MLRTHLLPCENEWKTWAGRGTGKACSACKLPIAVSDVEFELEFALARDVIVFHLLCHSEWLEGCHALLAGEPI